MSTFSDSLLPTDSLFLRPLASSASQKVLNKLVLKTCTSHQNYMNLLLSFATKERRMTSSMTIAKRKSNPTSEIWHVRYVKYCLRSNWQKIVFFCWQNASFPLLKTYQLHLFVANIKIWHHSWIFSCLSPEIQILRILESESGANLESIKTLEMSVLRNGLYELCQLQELVLENMVKIVRLVKLVNLTKLVNLMKLATLVKLSNLMRLVKPSRFFFSL